MSRYLLICAFVIQSFVLFGQSENWMIPPIKHQVRLAGTFGELRTNHFHTGVDIKSSNGKIGDKIYAVADGFVSRIKISSTGYGNALYIDHPNGKTTVYGLKYIDSGFAALLISSQPLILLFMLWALKGQKILARSYIGVAMGILGVFLLTYDQGMGGTFSWKGILLIYLALLSWGYGSIFVGSASLPKNQFVSSAYQMLFAGILLILFSLVIGEKWVSINDWSMKALASMSYLILLGSIIAFTSFNYLLKKVSPEKVATSTYINPIVAMFLGWLILQEQFSFLSVIAAFILLGGVYFINSTKGEKA